MANKANRKLGLTEKEILIGDLIRKRVGNKLASIIPQNEATDSKGLYHFKII